MGNILWGSVANTFLGKVTEAFQKKSKQFWCSGEKAGSGRKFPPLAIGGFKLAGLFRSVRVVFQIDHVVTMTVFPPRQRRKMNVL